jgi:predicted ATP-grasp superfamily ATP-dependent carboligase
MTAMQRDGEWTFRRGLEIYDQGGMIWLSTDEEDPQQIGIKMRNVSWPYGTNRPSLVLYAQRIGEARAVSYAWAEPTAKRLGINLRWMQASCTHAPRL